MLTWAILVAADLATGGSEPPTCRRRWGGRLRGTLDAHSSRLRLPVSLIQLPVRCGRHREQIDTSHA